MSSKERTDLPIQDRAVRVPWSSAPHPAFSRAVDTNDAVRIAAEWRTRATQVERSDSERAQDTAKAAWWASVAEASVGTGGLHAQTYRQPTDEYEWRQAMDRRDELLNQHRDADLATDTCGDAATDSA
jgi:hypothetical protein